MTTMASRKTKSRRSALKEPRELDPEKAGPVEPGAIDDPKAYERALEEGTLEELAPRAPREPRTELPDRSIQLTAKRCLLARSRDPIVAAFLHAEQLRDGGIRKMTREQWDQELDAFKSAPR